MVLTSIVPFREATQAASPSQSPIPILLGQADDPCIAKPDDLILGLPVGKRLTRRLR